ncbi:uncharacterized protein FSUBG_8889 [Fusarium subglutinans]|uniref:Chromo domain-containing protein n=1 Tax=Gibberella subglutinans TaxID=42677 RepID=A0A8H5UR77_GIBSU|nr:uncharacterized protein FSUBG_8889 [Fusarium subglutinans]KAF5596446.1 hypothetical protein FSUBG_8889 [Fusarium subglutinans]
MESASNAPVNSPRPDNTPTSFQRMNRSSNSAAGSSSRQSEMNRLIDNLANDVGYHDGDGQRTRENSLKSSARRGATPTPAQYVPVTDQSWRFPGGREAKGDFLFCVARREMDRRRDSQPNPTYISEERFPIEEFLDWRIIDGDSVVIKVRWADGSPDTEEPEEIMHIDSPETLLDFWRRHGGRVRATGLREHRILRVLKSKESEKDNSELLLCEWIGLPYTTWMSGEEVIDLALGQWLEFKTGVDNIFG